MSVAYEFPWPPRELSPNVSVHHMKLARAKREYKEDCGWTIRASKGSYYTLHAVRTHGRFAEQLKPPVTAQVTFVCDSRRRDPDNHMAMLKPMWDALVEMGVLVDDNKDALKILDPKWERGEKRVIVELRRD